MRPKPLVRILRHGEQNVAANISQVAVADPKLSNSIAQLPGLSLKTVSDSSTQDVFRAIRENLTSLLPDLLPAEEAATRLGLAHSLSRHKLRFSPDKVDTMIIQSIASLDVLDKQLNTYAMRVKEWYGWHFPELAKSKLQPSRRLLLQKYVTDKCDSSQRQPRLLPCGP